MSHIFDDGRWSVGWLVGSLVAREARSNCSHALHGSVIYFLFFVFVDLIIVIINDTHLSLVVS
jgi:phosphate starvation-inducible membrane PsiE